jgi:hypothetical protein
MGKVLIVTFIGTLLPPNQYFLEPTDNTEFLQGDQNSIFCFSFNGGEIQGILADVLGSKPCLDLWTFVYCSRSRGSSTSISSIAKSSGTYMKPPGSKESTFICC